MTRNQPSNDLASEFKDLLYSVSVDVTKSSVMPAIQGTQDQWTQQFRGMLEELQKRQDTKLAAFESKISQQVNFLSKSYHDSLQQFTNSTGEVDRWFKELMTWHRNESKSHVGVLSQASEELKQRASATTSTQQQLNEEYRVQGQILADTHASTAGLMQSTGQILADAHNNTAGLVQSTGEMFKDFKKPIFLGLSIRGFLVLIMFLQVLSLGTSVFAVIRPLLGI